MKKKAIIYTEKTDNLIQLAEFLIHDNWEIISAGETATLLKSQGIQVTIDKALLNNSTYSENYSQFLNYIITSKHGTKIPDDLDYDDLMGLVCINLKPRYNSLSEFLEESSSDNCINLKHISMIRAAAKNYRNILVLCDPEDYQEAIIQLKTDNISKDFRLYLAGKALNLTSAYDASNAISILFQRQKIEFPNYFVLPYEKIRKLTHGTNNHQNACIYTMNDRRSALTGMKKNQGRELDHNIIQNYFAAWNVVSMFLRIIKNPFEVPSTDCENYAFATQFTPAAGSVFTIGIKNTNPVGAALGANICESFQKTYNCAPDTFDGATLGCSAVIDADAAKVISQINLVCIIAPDFTKEARDIFSNNKTLRLITASKVITGIHVSETIDGGLLAETRDRDLFNKWHIVTKRRPTQAQADAMAFGMMVIHSAKSDSACIVNDSAAIGIATGMATRNRAVKHAIDDARESFLQGHTTSDTNSEVLVSDSYIPFDDKVRLISEIGVKAIIQTGGDETDQEFIDYCNEQDISMVFTGMTHYTY